MPLPVSGMSAGLVAHVNDDCAMRLFPLIGETCLYAATPSLVLNYTANLSPTIPAMPAHGAGPMGARAKMVPCGYSNIAWSTMVDVPKLGPHFSVQYHATGHIIPKSLARHGVYRAPCSRGFSRF